MLEQRKRTKIIEKMLAVFENSKQSDKAALTVTEYIRLLQIYEEMAENDSRPVTVRWVDSWDRTGTD